MNNELSVSDDRFECIRHCHTRGRPSKAALSAAGRSEYRRAGHPYKNEETQAATQAFRRRNTGNAIQLCDHRHLLVLSHAGKTYVNSQRSLLGYPFSNPSELDLFCGVSVMWRGECGFGWEETRTVAQRHVMPIKGLTIRLLDQIPGESQPGVGDQRVHPWVARPPHPTARFAEDWG